jgi:4,5-dihydroxyphthalate decarboxylase
MHKLTLTIACRAYDRVRALIDGTVTIEGCNVIVLPLKAKEIFLRAYDGADFDVSIAARPIKDNAHSRD